MSASNTIAPAELEEPYDRERLDKPMRFGPLLKETPALSWAGPPLGSLRRNRSAYALVILSLLAYVSSGNGGEPPARKYTNVERLALVHLKAVHDDVEKLKALRINVPLQPGLND